MPQQLYSPSLHFSAVMQRLASAETEDIPHLRDYAQSRLLDTGNDSWRIPLAYSYWRSSDFQRAVEALEPALATLGETDSDFNALLGMVSRKLTKKRHLSLPAYKRAIKINPSRADYYYNLGNYIRDDQPSSAERCYKLSLALDDSAHLCWHNLGIALNEQDLHQDALDAFKKAIVIAPSHADHWCNAGLACFGMDDFQSAISYFYKCLELDTRSDAGYINLGYAYMNQNMPQLALDALQKGIEIDSSSINAVWNLSLVHLVLGNYEEGWRLYQSRFDTDQFKNVFVPTSGRQPTSIADLPSPGEPPLVVWTEQGIGDGIQFVRYLYLLDALEVPFVFVTRKSLLGLMSNWVNLSQNVLLEKTWDPQSDSRPNIPLMSLPNIFNTTLATIPSFTPYLKRPKSPPSHLSIDVAPGGLSIGIAWASNRDNKAMYRHKSMDPTQLLQGILPLTSNDLVTVHSLQVGPDSNTFKQWSDIDGFNDWSEVLQNFEDTAYLVSQLDLIISVDTAVAHLAAALDKPTWLLLPSNSDFRWLQKREDSPWYPSMRLFRQSIHDDWESVTTMCLDALHETLGLDTSAFHS